MKSRIPYCIMLVFLATMSMSAHAGKMERAYQALQQHDYFKAKVLFSKTLKRNPSASAFGLATIYVRNNTPFFSKDTAYTYLLIAENEWGNAKVSKRERWAAFGWDSLGICELRSSIEALYYQDALAGNSVLSYTNFIQSFPRAAQRTSAIATRDSLAFFQVVQENTSSAYARFMEQYPASTYKEMAQENYYDAQFEEITGKGTLASYLAFIELNPKSPLIRHAEEKVFAIVTESNSAQEYAAFIASYPKNHFIDSAWRQLYQVSIAEYSRPNLENFKKSYPNYPYMKLVDSELAWMDSVLLPNYLNERYGFIRPSGKQWFKPQYEQVSSFHEGLSVVMLEGKFGVIDVLGNTRIPFEYDAISDFVHGRAIVEKEEKVGLIHRSGRMILPCKFDDIGMLSDGLVFTSTNGKYGYHDENGRLRIEAKFDDAFDFSNGVAKVEINDRQAYIDIYGAYVAQPAYAEIDIYSDSLFSFVDDGLIGLMDRLARVVVPAQFDELGRIHEGLAIASLHGELVYLNKRGEIVIQNDFEVFPNFILKAEFENGIATALKGEKYGRIDVNGNAILPFKYQNLDAYSAGLLFKEKELWGMINPAGKVLIRPEYVSLQMVDNKYLIAEMGTGTGVIDLKGNVVIPFTFDEIGYLASEIFVVRIGNTHGIMTKDSLVVELEYDKIGAFGEDFVFLSRSAVLSYYDLRTGRLITTKEE